jgi:hypothetical protein
MGSGKTRYDHQLVVLEEPLLKIDKRSSSICRLL